MKTQLDGPLPRHGCACALVADYGVRQAANATEGRRRMATGNQHVIIRRIARIAVMVAGVMAGVQRPAVAAPLDCFTGAPITLDVLIGLGADGCVDGARQLFDFTYSVVGTGGADEVQPANINVYAAIARGIDITFAGNWTVGASQTLEVQIAYRYRLPHLFAAAALTDPFEAQPSLTATACLQDDFPCAGGTLVDLPMIPVVPGSIPDFPFVSTFGAIRNSLHLDGGGVDPLQNAVSSVTNTLIPEPPSWTLFAIGFGMYRLGAFRSAAHHNRRRLG
jgi:hypothetical protein